MSEELSLVERINMELLVSKQRSFSESQLVTAWILFELGQMLGREVEFTNQ